MQIDNKKFYNASLKKYGKTAQGLHWSSQEAQRIRFKQLRELLPKELAHYTMIDAGCGFGDLFLYLREKGSLPLRYTGLDCMDVMVAEARRRTSCEIFECDILRDPLIEADFYCCSGAMNILDPFETQLFIRRCYDAARYGFVFNILWGAQEDLLYNYMQVEVIESIAKVLNATCSITTGYLEGDMSVALYKQKVGD